MTEAAAVIDSERAASKAAASCRAAPRPRPGPAQVDGAGPRGPGGGAAPSGLSRLGVSEPPRLHWSKCLFIENCRIHTLDIDIFPKIVIHK